MLLVMKKKNEIEFPDFRLRFDNATVNLFQCFYGAERMSIEYNRTFCTDDDNDTDINIASKNNNNNKNLKQDEIEECLEVLPTVKKIAACKGKGPEDPKCNNRLVCELNLKTSESLIAYELIEEIEDYGPDSGATLWIAPNMNTWVLLSKRMFDDEEEYEKSVVYNSVQSEPGIYVITTVINSFRVEVVEQEYTYTGWMATADIGGFIVFLYIFHTIAMIFVGIFLSNNSTFLRPAAATDPQYSEVGSHLNSGYSSSDKVNDNNL